MNKELLRETVHVLRCLKTDAEMALSGDWDTTTSEGIESFESQISLIENVLDRLIQELDSKPMKDGQTIGQWLNWDFKTNGGLYIRDKNGAPIYIELSNGFWAKFIRDSQANIIYYEDSDGVIRDNRAPEIIEHNGRKYQLIP